MRERWPGGDALEDSVREGPGLYPHPGISERYPGEQRRQPGGRSARGRRRRGRRLGPPLCALGAAASRAPRAARRSRRRRRRSTCQPCSQPAPDRPRLGVHVRDRDAGRGAEPDHRAAEADRVGEHPPVVAALLERQRGERDVVEHRRQEAEPERRLPGRRRAASRPASSRRTRTSESRKTRALEGAGQQRPVGLADRRGHEDAPPRPRRR